MWATLHGGTSQLVSGHGKTNTHTNTEIQKYRNTEIQKYRIHVYILYVRTHANMMHINACTFIFICKYIYIHIYIFICIYFIYTLQDITLAAYGFFLYIYIHVDPSAWIHEGTSHYDWRSFQDHHGFSWAAHRRVDGVSPVETTESIGSGDDEPGSSKLGSQALPTAAVPSQREKEEHFVSHYPFRSWCEHCIRGKAKAMKHVRVDHSDETVPVIWADYCFMNSVDDTVITEEVQKKHAPVLVVHGSWSKMTYAHVLPCKGVAQGPIGSKCLLNDLKKLG